MDFDFDDMPDPDQMKEETKTDVEFQAPYQVVSDLGLDDDGSAAQAARFTINKELPPPREKMRETPQTGFLQVELQTIKHMAKTVEEAEEKLLNTVQKGVSQDLADSGALEVEVRKNLAQLVFYAKSDKSCRTRVLQCLGKALQESCGKSASSKMSSCICWQMCELSHCLSFSDVEFYESMGETSPVVFVCGFNGSGIDDIRPISDRWASHYGAAAVVLSPFAGPERFEQLNTAYSQVIRLAAEGHPLVIHCISDGGYMLLKAFCEKWAAALEGTPQGVYDADGKCTVPSVDALKCVVLDSVGILDGDPRFVVPPPDWPGKDQGQPQTFPIGAAMGMKMVYTSCTLSMLKFYGLLKAANEEPMVSFDSCLDPTLMSERAAEGMGQVPLANSHFETQRGANILLGAPILMVFAMNDVMCSPPCIDLMANSIASQEGRSEKCGDAHPSAGKEVLGDNWDGVVFHALDKSTHGRHHEKHPDEYWRAIDQFAESALGMKSKS
eukprot:gnl/TRDRNA2_/TRDRNA2_184397_c0_seq1.p1 gnl/TRDRNA2_/TRDRNA2_184397_c0~~gnl/TRDRNA2_/TRDRNA2_184397_c0_seq1.p1  ORF type:complete len:498 (-),score=96.23 gnl/TRDRNA2_/TRDRNA2_184397_c0_seq1:62-1555(-)